MSAAEGAFRRREAWLARSEWAVALGITAFLLLLHVRNWLDAPQLWRDEISTLYISTAPTFAELWRRLEWESSPLVWPLLLRAWSAFGASAEWLRALALGVGAAVIASLWLALWRIAGTVPLLVLLLVAANPAVLRYGDTLRAYGLGLAVATLLTAAAFRLALRGGWRAAIPAALLAVLSVQVLYHNAVVVLALCAACAAAWALRRRAREAFVPLGIGALAAVSLLPYLGPLGRAREWNVVMHAPIDLAWLVARLRATVDVGGPWLSFVWAALACAALAACARRSARRADAQAALADERALALFFATALVVGVAGFALFLLAIGYPTQPWYYFSLLGLAAVSCEASLHLALRGAWLWRCARLALTVLALGLVAPALWRGNPERMTNLDRVAAELATRARPDDLIVVAPWYLGISFAHYYSGPTPWVTVPDLPDHSLTRYDLVKQHMIDPRGELESAERVRETLQRGARVFVVGELPFLEGNPPAIAPPVAPHSELGWREFHYQRLWSRMIAHALQTHATRVDAIPVELGVVSRFERPPLHAFGVGPL